MASQYSDVQTRKERRGFGRGLANCFGLPEPRSYISRTRRQGQLAVTELCVPESEAPTDPIAIDNAFLVALQIAACPDHELWLDNRSVAVEPFPSGCTSVYDLRSNPTAFMRNPSHSLHFYLPLASLNEFAEQSGAQPIDDLHHRAGIGEDDPVMRSLTYAILPMLGAEERTNDLFIEHVLNAVCAHVAVKYGGMTPAGQIAKGGLAPWQLNRAKELMCANLASDLSLKNLADECTLSVSHFSRAFRRSTGVTPHHWLLQQRVEVAKSHLNSSTMPLAEVAIACGFADQSHFTRVFSRHTGVSPGAWRRSRRS